MAEANEIEVGSFVTVKVTQNVKNTGKSVKGVVTGLDELTCSLHIPGWDYASETPSHIYGVAPFANGVPLVHLEICDDIPEQLSVVCESAQGKRISGIYTRDGVFKSEILPDNQTETLEVPRPKWVKPKDPEDENSKTVYLVFKAEKKKPCWIFTPDPEKDGGYALLAQDIWTPDRDVDIQRSEVWGSFNFTDGKWVADNSISISVVE